jgi:hypothetical protein
LNIQILLMILDSCKKMIDKEIEFITKNRKCFDKYLLKKIFINLHKIEEFYFRKDGYNNIVYDGCFYCWLRNEREPFMAWNKFYNCPKKVYTNHKIILDDLTFSNWFFINNVEYIKLKTIIF